jgi:hypothetical protein
MTENRRYALRLKAPFAWFDSTGSQQWHQFEPGDVVTDRGLIQLLESISAPVQRIPTEFKR